MINPLNKHNSNKGRIITEDDIPRIHHDLMVCYGWIDYDKFQGLPPHVVLTLHDLVQQERKAEQDYRKAVLKGLGYKIK